MVRKAVSCLLMFLILLIGFQQTIMILQFKFNQQQLEQAFCVNKNQPELACHGQCYLKKKLAEAEEKQTKEKIMNSMAYMILTEPLMEISALVLPFSSSINLQALSIAYTSPSLEVKIPPPNRLLNH